ncbi:hypothetical protein GCM10010277_80770 [Streptomyces longisporoflavus]|uniref:hypothetical protein n=1 Tax=Streptomyces longisporoflavus TaxID=28044 RepID=UPI00167DF02B|nr:hypothetical protein [Streptomyces longisporoflavus]GGV70124.1 hypothetical protein GCM10010277_80770 [Streptomyces longisporoflavus]
MGLEDDVRRLEEKRQADARRNQQAREAAAAPLPALLEEFATALRRRGVPLIPVHEYEVVEPKGNLRQFHPTRVVRGEGWLFSTFYDDGDRESGTSLVLMSDGATLITPLSQGLLKRRKGFFNRGYWPPGKFVCWDRSFTLTAYSGEDIEAVRAGMIKFLDRHR